ncbi:hypothetical protein FG385_24380 [Amycolatopsis alkalitolerans]|uniref:NmrA family transcriptional regulator n=1 Tax=Amycolatopsis alkalitolerans TaxID=2547244 RepID=A0A5C4LXB6_9PSEU|nr:hypothetical protein FG385_24380 [Amycolatopsis alkalitolerans]
MTGSLAMDDLLASTGAAFRALTMPAFMDNMLRQVRSIKEQGLFSDILSAGLRQPTVAARDIAAVAARLLLDPTWSGQEEVPVLGPQDPSADGMAAVMTEVLGLPVRYERIPGDALKNQLTARGVSEAMAQGMLDMMVAADNGLNLGVTRAPRHEIDTPTTFRQWCEEALAPAVRSLA